MRNRAVDTAEASLSRFLHHETDTVVVSFKMIQHIAKRGNTAVQCLFFGTDGADLPADGRLFLAQNSQSSLSRFRFFASGTDGVRVLSHGILQIGNLCADVCQLRFVFADILAKLAGSLVLGGDGIFQNVQPHSQIHQDVFVLLLLLEHLLQEVFLTAVPGEDVLTGGKATLQLFIRFSKTLRNAVVASVVRLQHFPSLGKQHALTGAVFLTGGDLCLFVDHVVFQHTVFVLRRTAFVRGGADLLVQAGCLLLGILGDIKQTVTLGLQLICRILGNLQLVTGQCAVRLGLFLIPMKVLHIVQPKGYVDLLLLSEKLQILSCLLGLTFQGSHAGLQFRENIRHAEHIGLGGIQLLLGLLLLESVLGNTGRFVKDTAALIALLGHDLRNTALADDGITLPADTRVHKQLVDIPQANRLAVDVVLTLPGAVVAAGNGDLIVGRIDAVFRIRIVKGDGYFGETHGAIAVGADEDNVLHLTAADILAGQLTQHPTHRVGDIGFTASVGTYDDRGTLVETNDRLIGERLKSVQFQGFQTHGISPPLLSFIEQISNITLYPICSDFSMIFTDFMPYLVHRCRIFSLLCPAAADALPAGTVNVAKDPFRQMPFLAFSSQEASIFRSIKALLANSPMAGWLGPAQRAAGSWRLSDSQSPARRQVSPFSSIIPITALIRSTASSTDKG